MAGTASRARSLLDHQNLLTLLVNETFFSTILQLKIEGETQAAILKDVQRHPAKNQILHMDLQRVLENEKIRMTHSAALQGRGRLAGREDAGRRRVAPAERRRSAVPAEGSAGVPGDRPVDDGDQRHQAPVGHSAARGRASWSTWRTAATSRSCRSIIRVPKKWKRRLPRLLPLRRDACCWCCCSRLRLRPLRVAMPRRKTASLPPVPLLHRRPRPRRRRKAARSNAPQACPPRRAGRDRGRCGSVLRIALSFASYCYGRHPSQDHRRSRQSRARASAHASQRGLLVRGCAGGQARRRAFAATRNSRARSAACRLSGSEVTLLKPMTYMNRSGLAIRALVDYLKVQPGEMLVVHDELDLPVGDVRFKLGGGAGGHNGLRDTITHLGADFWRLRLGIGHPGDKSRGHRLRPAARAEGRRGTARSPPSSEALAGAAGVPRTRRRARHERAAREIGNARYQSVITVWASSAASSVCRTSANRRSSMR